VIQKQKFIAMVKSNRVTILITCFFALAAILNEFRPSESIDVIKTYLVQSTGSGLTASNTDEKLGLVESFDLPTFMLLSISIIGGLFIIAYLKLSRSGKIISSQSILLARQEEELQKVRKALSNTTLSGEDLPEEIYSTDLSILSPVPASS